MHPTFAHLPHLEADPRSGIPSGLHVCAAKPEYEEVYFTAAPDTFLTWVVDLVNRLFCAAALASRARCCADGK
eukprot:363748-Chlamydomonas_euryale.AAC.1